jgi:endothelin-converting enzyme/putative endopeptidase
MQWEAQDSALSNAWLSPAARAASQEKVRALDLKVGYPDSWPSTGSFPLKADDFLANTLAAQVFQQRQSWDRVHALRDPHSWQVMVYPNAAPGLAVARLVIPNGYPDAYTNSMILTAALLRPPVFDPGAPPEVQFGTFGTIVGHEIVHVLEVHQFDSRGNASDFWSAEDIKSHESQSACLINQANEFVLFDDKHLDGRHTFDENVADLSGIPFAFAAMARELGQGIWQKGKDGLSPAQRFFIAYAQRNCTIERPAYFSENAPLDPHAPSRFRVNEPLSNMPEFARAFSCRAGSPMARQNSARCVVWSHNGLTQSSDR